MKAGGIAAKLRAWYDSSHRDLPWRRTKDPYAILVSEVMLQQTRVETVIPYYRGFLERFPSAENLARAPEPEVLAAWSGLGYYSRARNLKKAAQEIAAGGAFPRSLAGVRALPGVGPYTAAAIGSIVLGLPQAAVDGNVLRVVSRLTNDPSDIGSPATKARFTQVAERWLDPADPGRFNQAMMELGATLCLPHNPRCPECPLAGRCQARKHRTQNELPVKLRRLTPRRIEATLLLVERRGKVLLWQRPASEPRMGGFWELPSPDQIPAATGKILGKFRHTITNHQYHVTVRQATVRRIGDSFRWAGPADLATLPLSGTARKALRFCNTS
ncbi:MAG: A/G-specific adenine glycosylase [Acidobacteria bacterium]|nr:A/G-specific adenine glycosylase [Acidobacteriota bacterium]